MNRSTIIAILAVLAFPTSAQEGSKAVQRYFKDYRYTALKPPVAFDPADERAKDWLRPGYIFIYDKSKKPRSIGCKSVIQGAPVVANWLGDSNVSIKTKGSLSLASSLLSSVGKINENASAEAGFSWNRDSILTFENLRELQPVSAISKSEIAALGAGKSATLTGIVLDTACAARIRVHLKEGTPLYLVTSSVEADTIRVQVDNASGFTGKVGFSIQKLVEVKPGVEFKSEGTTSVSFSVKDRPVRLAIVATKIKMATPVGEVSDSGGDRVDITIGSPEVFDEMDFSNEQSER